MENQIPSGVGEKSLPDFFIQVDDKTISSIVPQSAYFLFQGNKSFAGKIQERGGGDYDLFFDIYMPIGEYKASKWRVEYWPIPKQTIERKGIYVNLFIDGIPKGVSVLIPSPL